MAFAAVLVVFAVLRAVVVFFAVAARGDAGAARVVRDAVYGASGCAAFVAFVARAGDLRAAGLPPLASSRDTASSSVSESRLSRAGTVALTPPCLT